MTGIVTSINAARVELLLNGLGLPGVKAILPERAAQEEGGPAEDSLFDFAGCQPAPPISNSTLPPR
jgi:hypothetical protein